MPEADRHLEEGHARGKVVITVRRFGQQQKAIVRDAYGPPDILELGDIAKPVPADDEVLESSRRLHQYGRCRLHVSMLYSVTMSVDGFIAGPGGDMTCLSEHLGPNPIADELIDKTGALVVGNRTFLGNDPYQGTPQEGEAFGGGGPGPSSFSLITRRKFRSRGSPLSATSHRESLLPRRRRRKSTLMSAPTLPDSVSKPASSTRSL